MKYDRSGFGVHGFQESFRFSVSQWPSNEAQLYWYHEQAMVVAE